MALPDSPEVLVHLVGFWRCTGARDFDDFRTGHGPFGTAAAEIEAWQLRVSPYAPEAL